MMEISQRVSPSLTESSNYIYLNEKLFNRVKAVYDQRASLNLNTEDAKLLEETFRSFQEKGANLNSADKEKYKELTKELSLLTLQFDQNSLKDQNRFEMLLTDQKRWLDFQKVLWMLPNSRLKRKAKRDGCLLWMRQAMVLSSNMPTQGIYGKRCTRHS